MSEPRITIVTVTTSSLTPDELIAAAYPGGVIPDTELLTTTRLISFVPFADGIFTATRAAATVNDVPLGMNTLTLQARRKEVSGARGVEFIAASSIKMAIIESNSEDVAPLTGQVSGGSDGGGSPGSISPVFLEKSDNAAARIDGTSVGGEVLAAATPYVRATITARKAVTDTDKASIANVGTVWICGAAEDIDGAFPLLPGQSMSLPDNCDLSDFFLAVDNLGDGVAISYTA